MAVWSCFKLGFPKEAVYSYFLEKYVQILSRQSAHRPVVYKIFNQKLLKENPFLFGLGVQFSDSMLCSLWEALSSISSDVEYAHTFHMSIILKNDSLYSVYLCISHKSTLQFNILCTFCTTPKQKI